MCVVCYQQLPLVNQIKVPRHAILHHPVDIQLHRFCNAPLIAYGACIYLRFIDKIGIINIQLLITQSRVAPLKIINLSRLELCGDILLVNLSSKVSQVLTCTISEQYFWTDSEIVLAWIRRKSSNWQTFVGNRVAELQRLINIHDWSHMRCTIRRI